MLLVIKGKVDDWRLKRDNAYLIYCSMTSKENIIDKFSLLPLPYDDEIVKAEEKETEQSIQAWYEMASSELANVKWN